jgi:hypothetical protein
MMTDKTTETLIALRDEKRTKECIENAREAGELEMTDSAFKKAAIGLVRNIDDDTQIAIILVEPTDSGEMGTITMSSLRTLAAVRRAIACLEQEIDSMVEESR